MKFLVCISKTPETTARIGFTSDGKQFDASGVQFIVNPYDEWYALVRALELKERDGGNVTVIHVGPAGNDVIIRKTLAIGADDAVRIDKEPKDAEDVARQIADWAADKDFDLILTGKETIDYNNSEVGAMLAELLDLPFLSYGSHLEIKGNMATVERDIEGGVEIASVETPFVLSASKGLAEQRIPNMKGIMMAKRKPLEVIQPVSTQVKVRVVKYHLPPEKGDVKLVEPENMDELVRLLHEEAKVI